MAEQSEPVKRKVALKVIKLGMDTKQVVARFEAERQALAIMDHPNIAKVLDGGATDTGRPFFVMEMVRGIKITDYCDREKLSTHQRLELFIQDCAAIQHAHQKGIIHRDIKPSNVMVTLDTANEPMPKAIDFGIAKATGGQQLTDKTLLTAFEQFIGTPAYMSPEQTDLTGLDIDTRSDIYNLGVLLYKLITGKTPFDTEQLLASGLDAMRHTLRDKEPTTRSLRVAMELAEGSKKKTPPRTENQPVRKHDGASEVAPALGVLRPEPELSSTVEEQRRFGAAHSKRSAPSETQDEATAARRQAHAKELIRDLRGDLDWIILKCLEKDRTRRYETANGIAMDVQRHLNNEPVLARPPSRLYRFGKMVRRNKVAFAAVNSVALAVAIGFGVSTWMYFKKKATRVRRCSSGKTAPRNIASLRRRRESKRSNNAMRQHAHSWKRRRTRKARGRWASSSKAYSAACGPTMQRARTRSCFGNCSTARRSGSTRSSRISRPSKRNCGTRCQSHTGNWDLQSVHCLWLEGLLNSGANCLRSPARASTWQSIIFGMCSATWERRTKSQIWRKNISKSRATFLARKVGRLRWR